MPVLAGVRCEGPPGTKVDGLPTDADSTIQAGSFRAFVR